MTPARDPHAYAKALFEQGHMLEPDLNPRGFKPLQYQPMIPNGPIRLPLDNQRSSSTEADLYRTLIAPETFADSLRSSIGVPNGPLTSPKGRHARMFTRGLASGFKNSRTDKSSRDRKIEALKLKIGGVGAVGGGRAAAGRSQHQDAADIALKNLRDAQTAAVKAGRAPPMIESDEALKRQRDAMADKAKRWVQQTAAGKAASGPTFAQKRKALDEKRDSELRRIKAVVTVLHGPLTETNYLGNAQLARLQMRTHGEYLKQLEALSKEDAASVAASSDGVVAGYDISRYATDPNHETAVAGHYKAIDDYIRAQAPDSPVTGEMVARAAEKHGVDPKMIVAIIQQDSIFGTKGKAVRTNNPGNVGNDDEGNERAYATVEEGVDAVGAWLKAHQAPADFSGVTSGGTGLQYNAQAPSGEAEYEKQAQAPRPKPTINAEALTIPKPAAKPTNKAKVPEKDEW